MKTAELDRALDRMTRDIESDEWIYRGVILEGLHHVYRAKPGEPAELLAQDCAWGYFSTFTTDAALAILADLLGHPREAAERAPRLVRDVLARKATGRPWEETGRQLRELSAP